MNLLKHLDSYWISPTLYLVCFFKTKPKCCSNTYGSFWTFDSITPGMQVTKLFSIMYRQVKIITQTDSSIYLWFYVKQ